MGIRLTNVEQVERYVKNYEKRQHEVMRNRLHRVGLNFVTEARSKADSDEWKEALKGVQRSAFGGYKVQIDQDTPSFQDQTAVLRSSIGYIITYNGFPIDMNFQGKNAEGISEAKKFANELVGGTVGYALICVAGANYAYYVEAKGYDVITGSSITAEQTLKKMFK